MLKEKTATQTVFERVASLPTGSEFTSTTISDDLGFDDPSLASAALRRPLREGMIEEIGRGPGRTIRYRVTGHVPEDPKFVRRLTSSPRPRAGGYTIENAARIDLPRLPGGGVFELPPWMKVRTVEAPTIDPTDLFGEGAASRPDLEGRPIDRASMGGPDKPTLVDPGAPTEFPHMDRPDVVRSVEKPRERARAAPKPDPRPEPPKPLSDRLREIADFVEAIETLVATADGKIPTD